MDVHSLGLGPRPKMDPVESPAKTELLGCCVVLATDAGPAKIEVPAKIEELVLGAESAAAAVLPVGGGPPGGFVPPGFCAPGLPRPLLLDFPDGAPWAPLGRDVLSVPQESSCLC